MEGYYIFLCSLYFIAFVVMPILEHYQEKKRDKIWEETQRLRDNLINEMEDLNTKEKH